MSCATGFFLWLAVSALFGFCWKRFMDRTDPPEPR